MFNLKAAHQRALRATMRVALCGTLAACGGGGKSKGSSSAEAVAKPGPTSSPTPGATPTTAGSPTPTTEAECRTALMAAYPNGDPKWYDPNGGTPRTKTDVSDAALASCCEAHAAALSEADYRKIGCCSAKFEGGHCTPWGPPMPPAMFA